MLYDPTSYYPQKIDERIFFQDNDIEKTEIINQYYKLISKGKYDESNDYISQQEGVHGLFADYLNALENRIHNLQEYLLNEEPKKNPFMMSDAEPIGTHSALTGYTNAQLSKYIHKGLTELVSSSLTTDEIIWI